MSTKAQNEGRDAAAKGIPADANPYKPETAEHEAWAEGHETLATAVEASQSEGS